MVNGPAQAGLTADQLPQGQIDVTIDTLFSSMNRPLVRGEKVELHGFRSFGLCRSRAFPLHTRQSLGEVGAQRRPWKGLPHEASTSHSGRSL